jgi:hypothetical protein
MVIAVTINGVTKTRYKHARLPIPPFVKHLRTLGEAGIIKNMKDGKVGDRGITMMFVGCAEEHAGNCYRMYNSVTLQICESRDIIWIGRMYFTTENCKKTMFLPVIAVPITNGMSNEGMKVTEVMKVTLPNYDSGEGKTTNAVTPKPSSKEGWMTVTTRKGRQVTPPSRYDPATGKMVTWNVTATEVDIEVKKTVNMGYYDIFNVTDNAEVTTIAVNHNLFAKLANAGAGVGGGFANTQELKVVTYNEAINGPDGNLWKEEVDNEFNQMVKNKVFKTVHKKILPPGTKIIDSIWAMKKKSNGTLCGQLNARGFKQVEGQHYNGTTISSPVTNSATIRIVLVSMVMASMMAHIVDVKGVFLHGEFEDGEKVHMAIPRGFKKHFPVGCVILLLKCLYGLKQAARAFWRQLLRAAKKMGLMRSSADPCLYYKWNNGRLVMMLSWIDDNAIVGCKKDVLNLKQDLMKQFNCDNCGKMEEYVGCTIKKLESGGIKLLQKVLVQSFNSEFDIESLKKFNTPATPGTVLKKPVEGDVLLTHENQTLYGSGMGKAMHMMQYSWPDIYQAVQDLARHMGSATKVHWDAMFRMMEYIRDIKERGLTLNPTQKWDGGNDHEFIINGQSDSDYAKDTQT